MKSLKFRYLLVSMVTLALALSMRSSLVLAQALSPKVQKVELQKSLGPTPAQDRSSISNDDQEKEILNKKIFETALVVLIGYLLIFIFVGITNKKIKEIRTRHFVRRNIVYFLTFLILLFVIFIWIQKINSLTIFLGVASAGLALALQEAILCIAGWFLILLRKPFDVGDRVELNGVKGDVIDIRLFQTSLLEIGNWVDADQSTGRIANVPNSAVFKKENYNYNRGFEYIWNEIPIMVTFESDWKRAEQIMLEHGQTYALGVEDGVQKKIESMARHYMIYYGKLTPIVYVNIKDSGVELILRYLTEAKKRRSTQDKLCRAILDDFAKEEKVNFAYTTYRIVKD
ncbi:MAG: mechanosensitive ion channel domain-containing protein [Candidatus Omnitrophota bacterium]